MSAPCTGVILAGGQASRYGGQPKGLERVHGERVIDRVAARARRGRLTRCCSSPTIPCARSGCPACASRATCVPGIGSLGGIHAALVHAGTRGDRRRVGHAVRPRRRCSRSCARGAKMRTSWRRRADSSRRGLEPLCAFYSQACVAPIERRIDADDRRVIGFFDQVRVARVPAEEVRALRRSRAAVHERQHTGRARARGAICLDRRS